MDFSKFRLIKFVLIIIIRGKNIMDGKQEIKGEIIIIDGNIYQRI